MERPLGMGSTFSAKPNSYQLLDWVRVQEQCILHRDSCNKACNSCVYFIGIDKSAELIAELKDIIRSRDPYLYFEDDVAAIRRLIESLDKNKEDTDV